MQNIPLNYHVKTLLYAADTLKKSMVWYIGLSTSRVRDKIAMSV